MFSIIAILWLFTSLLLPLNIFAAPSPVPTAESRLSTAPADWTGYQYRDEAGLGTYSFAYDIEDAATDNVQYRNEERHANGTVSGSYGYLQPDGNEHVVQYVADQRGHRAAVRINNRGQLKPVPVSDVSVHSDIEATNLNKVNINNPWRRFSGLHNHKYSQHQPPRPINVGHTQPSRPMNVPAIHTNGADAFPIRASPTVAYVAPARTIASLLFEINGQLEEIGLDRSDIVHHGTLLEILPVVNQGMHPAPHVVYLKK